MSLRRDLAALAFVAVVTSIIVGGALWYILGVWAAT